MSGGLLGTVTNIMTGGGYDKLNNAASVLNPLGTEQQQHYGALIGQLLQPGQFTQTAQAQGQNAFENAMYSTAPGGTARADTLMKPFASSLAGQSLFSYLGNLGTLSGATSNTLAAVSQQAITGANYQSNLLGSLAQGFGNAASYMGSADPYPIVDPSSYNAGGGFYNNATGSAYTGSDTAGFVGAVA